LMPVLLLSAATCQNVRPSRSVANNIFVRAFECCTDFRLPSNHPAILALSSVAAMCSAVLKPTRIPFTCISSDYSFSSFPHCSKTSSVGVHFSSNPSFVHKF
jgi:hypothetical protein